MTSFLFSICYLHAVLIAMKSITIGVTDCSKYNAYAQWIAGGPQVNVVKLSHGQDNAVDLAKCHGVLLTGGEDVHPRFYNKPEYLRYCYPDDVSEQRDESEFRILKYTQDKKLPVLGICRGLQVANVYFGGTLIPDIPSFGKFNHSKVSGHDGYHNVQVDPNSQLGKIAGASTGEVNSAHHQSAELVAPGLVANAISADGVIEGLEWLHPEDKPFLMLVQWHPERMKDLKSVFSALIRQRFLEAVKEGLQ